jgi:outer membrane lipopolysaccharide assembly protein LptE/RlpB
MPTGTLVRGVSLALLVVALSACGYALAGRGNSLPPEIRVIGVPTFVNQSSTSEVEREITDAMLSEFSSRGRLRAQPDAEGADAVLRGTITQVFLTPTAYNEAGQGTRYRLTIVANIEFVNQLDSDEVLWSNPSARVSEEYDVPPGTTGDLNAADPAAFFRQDTNALQRVARTFAATIVTSILEAF